MNPLIIIFIIAPNEANSDESSTNWFCKYQDGSNENDIRRNIETWLRIVSDKDKDLNTSNLDCSEPFQSFVTPHIDIHIGYLANRKSFNSLDYQIFKADKLLHEGVMTNGNIYANISNPRIHYWMGTLNIIIGSEKFRIQTKICKGKLHGLVRIWGKFPRDPNDDCETRIVKGLGLICKYANGVPSGKCWKGLLGGSWIYGEMEEDGEFSGRDIAYINQDMSTGYKGIFQRGLMLNASVVSIIGESCNKDGIKVFKFSKSNLYRGITFHYKRPGSDSMGDQPFVVDPLDNKYIDIGESSIDTGEDSQSFEENGAFAKVDIPPQTVITHINGYICNRKERYQWRNKQWKILEKKMGILETRTTFARESMDFESKMEENVRERIEKYSTDLGWNEYVEMPNEIGQKKSKYRSTLGHKINHCFRRQNSRFELYDSAQFGILLAVKTLNEIGILQGQEIFLHYGYIYKTCPKWYKNSFISFLMEQNDEGNNLDPRWQQMQNSVFSEENITSAADASDAALDKLLRYNWQFSENHKK